MKDNLRDVLEEKFDDFQVLPEEDLWSGVESRLIKTAKPRIITLRSYAIYAAAASIVILIGFLIANKTANDESVDQNGALASAVNTPDREQVAEPPQSTIPMTDQKELSSADVEDERDEISREIESNEELVKEIFVIKKEEISLKQTNESLVPEKEEVLEDRIEPTLEEVYASAAELQIYPQLGETEQLTITRVEEPISSVAIEKQTSINNVIHSATEQIQEWVESKEIIQKEKHISPEETYEVKRFRLGEFELVRKRHRQKVNLSKS